MAEKKSSSTISYFRNGVKYSERLVKRWGLSFVKSAKNFTNNTKWIDRNYPQSDPTKKAWRISYKIGNFILIWILFHPLRLAFDFFRSI